MPLEQSLGALCHTVRDKVQVRLAWGQQSWLAPGFEDEPEWPWAPQGPTCLFCYVSARTRHPPEALSSHGPAYTFCKTKLNKISS